ncbi:hypothetical protein BD779DRAFT_1561832 [Infundibulicybe gibba]|nr:hypothetical protein BD779DRAFT_1566055 [Infundibulicybe gibba]KAF8876018.1 hypothetical protein BD779DRAFT_1561832 [Infundibulicybe gibba]
MFVSSHPVIMTGRRGESGGQSESSFPRPSSEFTMASTDFALFSFSIQYNAMTTIQLITAWRFECSRLSSWLHHHLVLMALRLYTLYGFLFHAPGGTLMMLDASIGTSYAIHLILPNSL